MVCRELVPYEMYVDPIEIISELFRMHEFHHFMRTFSVQLVLFINHVPLAITTFVLVCKSKGSISSKYLMLTFKKIIIQFSNLQNKKSK